MNKIIILNKGVLYEPVLVGEVQWSTERQSTAGKLTFEVVKDEFIDFQEGNEVTFYFNEQPVFFGYVFEKTRDKSGTIKVTAYDQLRYFKNKDTYIAENIKASELLKIFISLFSLKEGHISDTGYFLPLFNEEGATLFDMIQVALDETLTHTQNIFTLYDDFGAICLKNVEEMRLNIMVNSETLENFDYSSSIDSDTYNQVKVVYKDKKTGRQAEAVSRSYENINKWGVLQYYETT
ncbi:MAG: XkdQ/YqbQ family protein, partial [Anaerotignaceae bacterium]